MRKKDGELVTSVANPFAAVRGNDGLTGYAETLGDTHDLEVHIDELKKIDVVRQKSVELRGQGNAALRDLIEEKVKVDSPTAYERAKAIRVALQVSRAYEKPPEFFIKKLAWLESLPLLSKQRRSVLLSAESMRALVATNEHTLSKGVMRCWYWIIRELYTAAKPDWAVGGARASRTGRVTGFTTSQCVHAVMDLSDSLSATYRVCEYLSKVSDTLSQLNKAGIPLEWQVTDKTRIAASCRNALKRQVPELAFKLLPLEDLTGKNVEQYVNTELTTELTKVMSKVATEFDALIQEIDRFRDKEERDDDRFCAESSMGHAIALSAIRKGSELVKLVVVALKEPGNPWSTVGEHFKVAGLGVKEGLLAARKYLSTVIDEQLAASALADGSQWEPAELAFAANAYLAMTKHEALHDRERLQRAACLVQQSFGADGTVLVRRFYHVDEEGSYRVRNGSVMAAAADVLRAMELPLDSLFVRRLLPSLMKHSMQVDEWILGWQAAFPTSESGPDMLETACAVEALAAVNRLLDDGINRIILEHFSVKYPSRGSLELDMLFYPDYGLAQPAPKGSQVERLVRPTCAITFQRLQAHVNRTNMEPLHSLVLHGPAGTGKTTLVEALAQTCDVPMVEVTPSDLAKGGEAELERRARTVFEALSLLTHVVILFDEFDPILRRRDKTGKGRFTYFSFLTPGMLPKLKNLSEKAKKQSVAYILNTNLLGTLDEAAVRKGRFDEKVGVFSPDPLSRMGRLALVTNLLKDTGLEGYGVRDDERLREAVYKTGGLGMPALTEKGWYINDDNRERVCPINYVFGLCDEVYPEVPEPEDPFDGKVRGKGKIAEKEAQQWRWLFEWDRILEDMPSNIDCNVLAARLEKLGTIRLRKPGGLKRVRRRVLVRTVVVRV